MAFRLHSLPKIISNIHLVIEKNILFILFIYYLFYLFVILYIYYLFLENQKLEKFKEILQDQSLPFYNGKLIFLFH